MSVCAGGDPAVNCRTSAATMDPHMADGYTSGSSSDNPPAANPDTRSWSFKWSVFLMATRMPLDRRISLAPIPGHSLRETTSPGWGSAWTSRSGTSPDSQGPMREAASAASTRETAAAMSAAVTLLVCSDALMTQELAEVRRAAQAATSSVVIPGSSALLIRDSSSGPAREGGFGVGRTTHTHGSALCEDGEPQ